jgi:predicted small lipoprotein YifL
MKKKLLAMLLAVVMVCGVAGCGKDKTLRTDSR